MTVKQKGFELTARSIIEDLHKRNMQGFFCETGKDAVDLILSQLPEGASIGWGGSETIKEIGLLDALKEGNYDLIDRATARNAEESRALYGRMAMADAFLMSSNAITERGELVNIDGAANRLACLLHGPKEVYVIVGMNKLVKDVPAGLGRIRSIACPANTLRLGRKTPCALTGRCGDCFGDDSICSEIVITRRSSQPGRIKVFLVAEDYGF
ncbi:MAG: lactate utilization protein [Lachnospiraceae bacterium]|nr:lactate utilization protein [Lachnospiraceae bacterium]